jgi:hypothetical protein
MTRRDRLAAMLAAACLAAAAAGGAAPETTPGPELAARLRAAAPEAHGVVTGTLRQRTATGRRSAPLKITTTVHGAGWEVRYQAGTNVPAEEFIVTYAAGRPARYERRVGGDAPQPATAADRLAGSDFFLGDVGLEFLHWPDQQVLRRELRRSRWCQVLESTAPAEAAGLPYRRVVTWVDDETGGFIRAEAHDLEGRLWKVFSPGGVRRVAAGNGYELKDMEIADMLADTFTVLEFDRAPAVPGTGLEK